MASSTWPSMFEAAAEPLEASARLGCPPSAWPSFRAAFGATLDPEALRPTYGLAEHTVFVCSNGAGRLEADAARRWVHADPCENRLDRPMMYEAGWKKKLSYVLAFGRDGCADVITLSDASWANKPDMSNEHGWMQTMCGAAFDWRSFSAARAADARTAAGADRCARRAKLDRARVRAARERHAPFRGVRTPREMMIPRRK